MNDIPKVEEFSSGYFCPLPGTETGPEVYSDDYLRGILRSVKTIAMVGASARWNRPSYFAMKYLVRKGYKIFPVNPRAAEESEILGARTYASLAEVPGPVDMVDIFRPSEEAGPIADAAIRLGARVLWMQLGVRDEAAAQRAEAAGLMVVMNRCPKIEYARLNGELGWNGINTGVLSSRRKIL
jgi:predicted CoA-binding protein